MEEKGVHAHYASIERLTELENGKVEWRMATSSKAGGAVPQFMTEMSMASNISHVRFATPSPVFLNTDGHPAGRPGLPQLAEVHKGEACADRDD